jgi:hypothetical protein
MGFIIRENANGPYISIETNNFEEGINFVKENRLEQIQLKGSITKDVHNIDFKLFESISNQLKTLSISDLNSKISVIQNPDSLYKLRELKTFFINQKIDFNIDFSLFESLTQAGLVYSPKILNLPKASRIETLVITSGYPQKDLIFISSIISLKTLHIYKSSVLENIKGVEKLANLEDLKLAFNTKLNNIEAVNNSGVQKLQIEKCKSLNDFSFLKNNVSIKELFIDELDSIEFITTMANLEKINFWNNKDGDMTPLLKAKGLSQINFFPDKKHYSHTLKEIIEKTGARQGKNK